MKELLFILSTFLFVNTANADTLTLSYVGTDYDYSPAYVEAILDDSANGASLTYGFTLNSIWSLDVSYKNLGDATRNIYGYQTKVDTDMVTLMMNAHTQVGTFMGNPINLHGMVGLARADIDVSVGAATFSDSDVGLAYGVGARLWVTPQDAVGITVTKYDLRFDNNAQFDLDPMLIEVGYTRSF